MTMTKKPGEVTRQHWVVLLPLPPISRVASFWNPVALPYNRYLLNLIRLSEFASFDCRCACQQSGF